MSTQSVLYDAPGPKAKVRNLVYTVLFLLVLAGVAWLVLGRLGERGELDGDKWSPFLQGGVWTEFILPGLGITLLVALISIVIALPLGGIFGLLRMSDHRYVSWPSGIVVELFRAVPVLIFMIFADQLYAYYTDIDRDFRPIAAAVTGLVLYNAAVLAEIVRAGVASLPKGQGEAAYALGLRKTQAMTQVLLPQAVKVMLPSIISQLVVILKDSALAGGALGLADLLGSADLINSNFSNVVSSYIVIAVIYILLNGALTSAASLLQKRMARGKKAPPSTAAATVALADAEAQASGSIRI